MRLAVVLCVVFLSACAGAQEKKEVLGEWKVISFESNLPEISPLVIEEGKRIALSSTYIFNQDLTCDQVCSYLDETKTGEWSIGAEGLELIIDWNIEGKVEKETIKFDHISSDLMIWTNDFGKIGTLTMKLEKQ